MLSNITLGQYFPGDTAVHRLDPRTKILLILAIMILIFAITDFAAYGILALFFLTVVLTARLNILAVIKSVKPLWVIILITLLVHFVSHKGEVLYEFFIFSITREGIEAGILMSVRIVFLILFSSLLTMTTSPLELTDGLEKLLRPFKRFGLPAHELAMMMTIALRFIPTLLGETERIMMAQSARGAEFSSGPFMRRAKNMLALIVPLFLSAFRRADELATAMEARCYHGGEGRTRMYQLAFSSIDAYACIVVILVGCIMGYAKWYV